MPGFNRWCNSFEYSYIRLARRDEANRFPRLEIRSLLCHFLISNSSRIYQQKLLLFEYTLQKVIRTLPIFYNINLQRSDLN